MRRRQARPVPSFGFRAIGLGGKNAAVAAGSNARGRLRSGRGRPGGFPLGRVVRLLACVGIAVVAPSVAAQPGLAAPGGGACALNGTANFDGGGLTATSAPFTYNFAGDLSSCNSNNNAPATGTVKAGTAYQVTVPYAVNGITYS